MELKKGKFREKVIDVVPILAKRTRFHHTKAKHLEIMKKKYPEVHSVLIAEKHAAKKREYLVKEVKGLGLKEASHLLRNIGHRNLAILDRHILKNLKKYGAIRSLPKSLTPKKYFSIEKRFKAFSKDIGISMDELDLLFWSMQTGTVFK